MGARVDQRAGLRRLHYPWNVTTREPGGDFAESAGARLLEAFALCSFASQLAGKARQ